MIWAGLVLCLLGCSPQSKLDRIRRQSLGAQVVLAEEHELPELERGYDAYSPLMRPEGRAAVDEKGFFERLYSILFEQKESASTYNMAELEILAIEKYLDSHSEQLNGFKKNLQELFSLTQIVAEQQRRIERLEKIISEKLT